MSNFFEVKNLCYAYIKKPLCLKDVSFCMEENEKILIFGNKDSGKTTLIKTLSGFDEKYFGSIKLLGNEMKSIPDAEKNVSLILDYPTLTRGTIEQNIDFATKTLNKEIISPEEKLELLKKFGLNFELKTKVKNLTTFEKFKLCFLRSYIKNPRIIFIDDILKNDFTEDELNELKLILNLVCNEKLVIFCVGKESYLKNASFYDWFDANKVFYLNLAKLSDFKSIQEMLNCPADLDACGFNKDFCQKKGYCVKQNGRYYLSVEDKFVVKIDKNLNFCFDKLNLGDCENEDVVIVHKTGDLVDFSKNNDINKQLSNKKVKIFSEIDRSRVI